MFLRAVLAFLVLPGVVAFAVPLLFLRPPGRLFVFTPAATLVLGAGLVVLGWCVRDFYVLGRGTLAPWSPPQRLVVRGLYRFSRNPMYLGVLMIVTGWALGFRSSAIGWYVPALAVLFHLRVMIGEEPWLAQRHGTVWTDYVARVPRWLGPIGGRATGRN